MAGSVEGAGFWLPSEFLTDDDFLMDKENFNKRNSTESASEFGFPTELPYGFETEGDQRREKFWVMSTSPQSTLTYLGSWPGRAGGSSNGSPNGVPSPPMTPLGAKYDAVGDLIYRAADQVAKLKLNGGDGLGLRLPMYKGLLGPPKSLSQFHSEAKSPNPSCFSNAHFQQKQQNELCRMRYNQQKLYENRGRALSGTAQAAWAFQPNPTRGRAVLSRGSGGSGGGSGGGAPAKRACAGTGVFLPRRYGNNNDGNGYSSDPRKKPGSTAVFPGTASVYAPTENLSYMNGFAQSQQHQTRTNRGSVPDFSLYRRHAIVLQNRQSLLTSLAEGSPMMSRDIRFLPQEWTY